MVLPVPNFNLAVSLAEGEVPPVTRQCDASFPSRIVWARIACQFTARSQIPDGGAVGIRPGEGFPVTGKDQGIDIRRVGDVDNYISGCDIPEPDDPIVATGREQFGVWRNGQGMD